MSATPDIAPENAGEPARSAPLGLPGFSIEDTVVHVVRFTAAGIRHYLAETPG